MISLSFSKIVAIVCLLSTEQFLQRAAAELLVSKSEEFDYCGQQWPRQQAVKIEVYDLCTENGALCCSDCASGTTRWLDQQQLVCTRFFHGTSYNGFPFVGHVMLPATANGFWMATNKFPRKQQELLLLLVWCIDSRSWYWCLNWRIIVARTPAWHTSFRGNDLSCYWITSETKSILKTMYEESLVQ